MSRCTSLLLAVLAATSALAVCAPAAPAGGADNVAVAVNTRDDSSVYRLRFKIVRSNGEVVETGNAAVAAASCSSCKTVAVAMQTVLLFEDPQVFTPTNLAIASNVDCSQCETLASAYQTFVQTDGPARFSADGNVRLAEIRRELQALRHSDASVWETQENVDALNTELQDVLDTELVQAGRQQPEPPANATEATPNPPAPDDPPEPADDGSAGTEVEAPSDPVPEQSTEVEAEAGAEGGG